MAKVKVSMRPLLIKGYPRVRVTYTSIDFPYDYRKAKVFPTRIVLNGRPYKLRLKERLSLVSELLPGVKREAKAYLRKHPNTTILHLRHQYSWVISTIKVPAGIVRMVGFYTPVR